MTAPNETPHDPQPRRVLGLRDLVLFYVVATLSLRWLPLAAALGPSTIVIWLLGVLTIFMPLALCVMELSSRYPQEGGMYVWSKRAFGDFAGFLTGWIYWTSNLTYFPAVLYFAASNALYIGGSRWLKLAKQRHVFHCVFARRPRPGTVFERDWTEHREVAQQPGSDRNMGAGGVACLCGYCGLVEVWLSYQLRFPLADADAQAI